MLGREGDCLVSGWEEFGGVLEAVEVCVCWGVAGLLMGRKLWFWVLSGLSLRCTNEVIGGGRRRRVLF